MLMGVVSPCTCMVAVLMVETRPHRQIIQATVVARKAVVFLQAVLNAEMMCFSLGLMVGVYGLIPPLALHGISIHAWIKEALFQEDLGLACCLLIQASMKG